MIKNDEACIKMRDIFVTPFQQFAHRSKTFFSTQIKIDRYLNLHPQFLRKNIHPASNL
jgi:hypothetical protein